MIEAILIEWCYYLSISFTLIFILFCTISFIRYKPVIAKTQLATIILSVINLVTKNAEFWYLDAYSASPDPTILLKII